jgi:glutamate-ammonia-ligase adenylyltransferase
MGKCGGRELNYVSDVDVVFVAEAVDGAAEEPALRAAAALASALMRACSTPRRRAPSGRWTRRCALRARPGRWCGTLASHVAYYQRLAKTWEFQALLKARPVAGDLALGQAYVDAMAPMVWAAAERDDFVVDVQQMRRRVEQTLPDADSHRELKLGPGGLRDVEFAVQLLQLVHGRTDESLRSPNTLEALESLSTTGYVGRDDAAELDRAYRFLRTVEHRLQLHLLRRTHVMPDDPDALRRLARSVGLRTDPVEELDREWRQHAREVRRLHEKLFYRPLLSSVARLASAEARLTPEAARRGWRHWATRTRRRAAAPRSPDRRGQPPRRDPAHPAAGAARLVRRRAGPGRGTAGVPPAQRLAGHDPLVPAAAPRRGRRRAPAGLLLASSRYAVDLLGRAPEAVRLLADDAELVPRAPGAATEVAAPPSAGTRTPPVPSPWPGAYAGASCSGSRQPTCSARPPSSRSRPR